MTASSRATTNERETAHVMYHRPACVVVGQDESFLMMSREVSAPPRSPNTSALGTRMQNP